MKLTMHLSADENQLRHLHQMLILLSLGHVSFQLHLKMMLSTAKNMELSLLANGVNATTAMELDQITRLENLPQQDMQLTETNVMTYAYVVPWYAKTANIIACPNPTDMLPDDAPSMMNYLHWQNRRLASRITWDMVLNS